MEPFFLGKTWYKFKIKKALRFQESFSLVLSQTTDNHFDYHNTTSYILLYFTKNT